jgi:hypothetical protein
MRVRYSGTLHTIWITYLGRKCQSPHCSTLLWQRDNSLAHCRPCESRTWVASASLLIALLPMATRHFSGILQTSISPTLVTSASLLVAVLSCGDEVLFLWHTADHVDNLPGFSSTSLTFLWQRGIILAHCRPRGWVTYLGKCQSPRCRTLL